MNLSELINTYASFMQRKYERRVQRVPLSTGIPCPHGKCIFCRPDTFTDPVSNQDVITQFHTLTDRMGKMFKHPAWIPYFNAETGTYGDLTQLKRIFQTALQQQNVVELAISTRPDCVSEEVCTLLKGLEKPVTVEIGMQTIHDRSLDFLRRGHTHAQTEQALELLKRYGIRTGVHLIIGIPGETIDDMLETVRWISGSGLIDEVKFHQLVIYRDTELEKIMQHDRFIPLTTSDYLTILTRLLPELDERIVVSRMFTSNVRRTGVAIAPDTGSKLEAMNELGQRLKSGNIRQGATWNANSNGRSTR